ncbi:16718_t:CDS:2, partial [Acaulospora colombiana]
MLFSKHRPQGRDHMDYAKLKKDTTNLKAGNVELKARVEKLEQKQLQNDEEKNNYIVLRSNDTTASKPDDDIREIKQSSFNKSSTETENPNVTPEKTVSQNKN